MKSTLSREEVCRRVGLSYWAIWDRMRKGEFPRPIDVGGKNHTARWYTSEVAAWLAARPRKTYGSKLNATKPNRYERPYPRPRVRPTAETLAMWAEKYGEA